MTIGCIVNSRLILSIRLKHGYTVLSEFSPVWLKNCSSSSSVSYQLLKGLQTRSVSWFHQLNKRSFSTSQYNRKKELVTVSFLKPNNEKVTTQGKEGDSLLDVVVDKNIDIDGFDIVNAGACEGTLACSTCHLILKEKDFERLKDKPTDEEMDMLDLAFGLCDTSRLGCQVFLTKDLDGLEVKVPDTINDARQS